MSYGLELNLSEFASLGLDTWGEDLLNALSKPPLSDPKLEGVKLQVICPDEYEMPNAVALVLSRLQRIVKEFNQHRIRYDDILGELWWDEDECYWELVIETGDRLLDIKIHALNQQSSEELKRAREFVADIDNQVQRLRNQTGRELYRQFDTTWDDQVAESPEWYARQLTLTNVIFEQTGGFTAWFDIGELFADHAISANVDIHGKVESVHLEG